MRVMPRTRRLLGKRGVTFANALASYPLCCPSRATFLTGQYAHNHDVIDNRPPEGGYEKLDASEYLPIWLKRSGYLTAHIGKYLNDYMEEDGVPPGWDRWFGMVEPAARYFKAKFLDENGELHELGTRPEDYSTDVMTRKAVELISQRGPEDPPFYLSVGYVAPHVGKSQLSGGHCSGKGPEPAPRHLGRFRGRPIPRTPAFNESDVSDKPRVIQKLEPLAGSKLREKTDKYQCRLETLLAVDESVERIVRALREVGELRNTYVIFVSDNGFVQGDHRIEGGKAVPYENSLRIPLLIRGPGVARGAVARDLVSNADIPATVLDIAQAEAGLSVDGTSILDMLARPSELRGRAIPIESYREDGFHGVRTDRYTYVERHTGEVELYDLRADPFQLESVHDDPQYAAAREALAELTAQLEECAGEDCERRPRLELDARRRSGRTDESACSEQVSIALTGADAEAVAEVRLTLAGRSLGPLGRSPREFELDPGSRARVRANVEMIDGRLVTLVADVPACEAG